jgi:hypothetical protein
MRVAFGSCAGGLGLDGWVAADRACLCDFAGSIFDGAESAAYAELAKQIATAAAKKRGRNVFSEKFDTMALPDGPAPCDLG